MVDEEQHVEAEDSLSISESVVIHKTGEDGSEGFRTSRSGEDPRQSGSDSSGTGSVSDNVAGRASPKNASELRTAALLVSALNANLAADLRWDPPMTWELPEEGVDCFALQQSGSVLKIQVTTPETDAWSYNARNTDDFSRTESKLQAAADLKSAIEKKRLKAHPDITLALDAVDSTRYAHRDVVKCFRQTHGGWAQALNFAEIWLVGPTPETVYRLDS